MPDCDRTPGTPWGAHFSGSCLPIAYSWLALFGPRPAFVFSTLRLETTWQQWTEDKRHCGLARFRVESDGWIDREPVQTIPRKKPCQVSERQWANPGV